jgi:hypothetical protein
LNEVGNGLANVIFEKASPSAGFLSPFRAFKPSVHISAFLAQAEPILLEFGSTTPRLPPV